MTSPIRYNDHDVINGGIVNHDRFIVRCKAENESRIPEKYQRYTQGKYSVQGN